MNEDILKLLEQIKGTQLYDQLVSYLVSRNALPNVSAEYLNEATDGQFTTNTAFGNKLPPNGEIFINKANLKNTPTKELLNTLSHETTHAADRQLTNQWYEIAAKKNRTKEEDRFLDAYNKLSYGYSPKEDKEATFLSREKFVSRAAELASKLNPEWTKENSTYRASGTELSAFGVGNSLFPTPSGRASFSPPEHLDATLATERSILLDAAMRARSR
jgi:hypothetical protein